MGNSQYVSCELDNTHKVHPDYLLKCEFCNSLVCSKCYTTKQLSSKVIVVCTMCDKKCANCKNEFTFDNMHFKDNKLVAGTQCDQCGKSFCKECNKCINIYLCNNDKIETFCCMCKIPRGSYKLS